MHHILITMISITLLGCTWVKTSEEGARVALVKYTHVMNCKKLGSTSSSVKGSIGFVNRKERKVADELITLAKNEAVKLGGDTIVAVGEIDQGQQNFDIYSCSQ